jgi:hypothetical protein
MRTAVVISVRWRARPPASGRIRAYRFSSGPAPRGRATSILREWKADHAAYLIPDRVSFRNPMTKLEATLPACPSRRSGVSKRDRDVLLHEQDADALCAQSAQNEQPPGPRSARG